MTLGTATRLLAALLLFVAVLGGAAAAQETPPASPTPAPTLSDLEDVDQLRELFNEQSGTPRLLLLLSPT